MPHISWKSLLFLCVFLFCLSGVSFSAPAAPVLTASRSGLSNSSIILNWTVPATTVSFQLKRSFNGANPIIISSSLDPDTTTLTQNGLPEGTYVYTIYAIDASNSTSNAGTSTPLIIDTTPPLMPTVTASKPVINGKIINLSWNIPDTTAKFTLKRSLNGGSINNVSSNILATTTSYTQSNLADGTYVYYLNALDSYSNVSKTGTANTIVIDTTPPSAPTITASKPVINGTTISLSWTVPATTAAFQLKRSFNGGALTVVSSNMSSSVTGLTETGLADGTYSYSLYAIDSFTNTSNAGTSSTVTIDTVAPSAPTLTAAKNRANGSTILLSWTVPSTTSKFQLKRSVNGGGLTVVSSNISSAVTSWTQTGLVDGTYSYSLYAIDAFSNTSNAGVSSTLTIDTVAPATPTVSATKPASNSSSIVVSWLTPAGTSFFQLKRSFNGGGLTTVSSNISGSLSSLTQTNLAEGTYVYSLYAVDAFSNTSNVSVSNTVVVDTTPPNAPVLTASKNKLNGNNIQLSWTVPATTASFQLKRSFNGGALTVVSSNISSSVTSMTVSGLADGTYSFSLYALDAFTNTSNAGTSSTLTIDTTPPSAPTLTATRGSNNSSIVLNWNVPATTASFILKRSFNNGPQTTVSSSLDSATTTLTQSGLAEGTYVYTIFALDSFTNTSNAGVSDSFVVDTTPPAAPSITAAKTSLNGNGITLSWTVPNTTSTFILKRSLDGGSITTVSSNIPASVTSFTQTGLADGSYVYYLNALDAYSNVSKTGTSNAIVTDTTPPAAPVITATKPLSNGTTITLSWDVPATTESFLLKRSYNNGTATVVSNELNAASTSYSQVNLAEGNYVYYLYAIDAYGNTSNVGVSQTMVIDTTPPGSPTITGSKTSLNGDSVALSWTVPFDTSSFILKRSLNNGTPIIISSNIAVTTTSLTQKNLADGTYVFYVYAADSYLNQSSPALTSSFIIDTTPPSPPVVTATKPVSSGTAVNLSWTVPATTASFILKRSFNGGSQTLVSGNMSASTTSFSQTGLSEGTYTYYVYGLDSYSNTSNAGISNTVTIDTTPPDPPTITATKPQPNATSVVLSWTIPATTATYVLKQSVNGGPQTVVSTNILYAVTSLTVSKLPEGLYTYYLYALDSFANTSNAGVSTVVTIDTTPPDTPHFSAVRTPLNSTSIYMSWDVPDTTTSFTLMRSKDGVPASIVTTNVATSITKFDQHGMGDGTYIYTLYAVDVYSNMSVAASSGAIIIDTTPPATPKITVTKDKPNGNAIDLSWNVPDTTASFLLKKVFNKDAAVIVSSNIPASVTTYSLSNLADGTYSFNLNALDNFNNTSNAGTSGTVTIDTTPPSAPHIFASKPVINGNSISLVWDIPLSTSTFILKQSLNGGDLVTVNSTIPFSVSTANVSGLSDGTYVFYLYSVDTFSNVSAAGTSLPLLIDTTPPAAPKVTAVKPLLNGDSVLVSWDIPTTSTYLVLKQSLNGKPGVVISANVSTAVTSTLIKKLEDGIYSFSLNAFDSYNNTSNAGTSTQVTIDTTPPVAPVIVASKAQLNSNAISLSWNIPATTVSLALKRIYKNQPPETISANVSTLVTSFTDTNLSDGSYSYRLYAFDAYTNTSNAGASETLTIDTVAPTTPRITAAKTSTNSNTVLLSWDVPSTTSTLILKQIFNDTVTTVLNQTLTPATITYNVSNLPDGPYSFSLTAVDAYGNTSSEGFTSSLIIDTTPPLAPTSLTATANEATLNLTWKNPDDAVSIILQRLDNSGIWGGVTINQNVLVDSYVFSEHINGTFYYGVKAVDAYGNISNLASVTAIVEGKPDLDKFLSRGEVSKGVIDVTSNVSGVLNSPRIGTGGNSATLNINARYMSSGTKVGIGIGSVGWVLLSRDASNWSDNDDVTVGESGGTGYIIQYAGTATFLKKLKLGHGIGSRGYYRLINGALNVNSLEIGSEGGFGQFDWLGGTLQAKGVVGDLNNQGGTLLIQSDTPLTVTGNYTQTSAGSMKFKLGAAFSSLSKRSIANSSIPALFKNTGTLSLRGTIILEKNGYVPKLGDKIRLVKRDSSQISSLSSMSVSGVGITSQSVNDSAVTFVLPTLDPRMSWDTSEFETAGVVSVVAATSSLINGRPLNHPNPFRLSDGTQIGYWLNADADVELRVYTVTGSEVYRKNFVAGMDDGARAGYNNILINYSTIQTSLPSGVYPYILISSGSIVGRGRMVLKPD